MSGVQQAVFQNQRSFGAPPDAQFNYVTMLLHGDGTNGAQNNTFLDSSTNAFTITRNGNTTQGSFSPYGSNWSNYFAGADYLTLASNTAFNIFGGDMTVECWFNATSLTNSPHLFAFVQDASNRESIYFNSGALTFYSSSGAGSGNRIATATLSTGVWYHYALVKSGSTFTAYLNGVAVGTSTTTQYSTANQSLQIGTYNSGGYVGDNFYGYISNVRVVKGTAVYTSSFTPSTTPLTAITNTQLLTCQSNRFVDNSASPLTITATATSVQRFNPFGASTAYDTSVIGGSGYFDGAGDSLQAPSGASISGTGDFTAECWIYPTAAPSIYNVIACSDTNTGLTMFGLNASGTIFYGKSLVSVDGTTSNSVNYNAWNYIAISRSSGTIKMFINGVQGYSATQTQSYNSGTVRFGTDGGGSALPYTGYISNFRINPNSALYTSGFTPPTAPTTAISGTSLLLNMTNGAIIDNAMMNDLETVGNAQISTSVKKYGTGSLSFDGTGDSLLSTGTLNAAFGTGDFTIEFWLNPNTIIPLYQGIIDTRPAGGASTNAFLIYIEAGGTLYYFSNGANIVSYTPISTSTWIHVAITRSSGSLRLFINGTISGSAVSNTQNLSETRIIVGSTYDNFYFNGYIDDLRLTKGYARYTANFTPPTAALLDTGPY